MTTSSERNLRSLANTSDQNHPNSRQAYINAAQKKYVHAVVDEPARRVGFLAMRSKTETITYPCRQQIYPKVY